MNERTNSPTSPHAPRTTEFRRLDACIEHRNRAEASAASVAIILLVVFGAMGLSGSAELHQSIAASGLILVAAGLAYTLWKLRRHATLQHGAIDSRGDTDAAWLRRERDLLRTVWAWYVAPVLPGFLLTWGAMLAGGAVGTALFGMAVTLCVLAWIISANVHAAAEFDRRLRDLERAAN